MMVAAILDSAAINDGLTKYYIFSFFSLKKKSGTRKYRDSVCA